MLATLALVAAKPRWARADDPDATDMLLDLVKDRAKAAALGAAWIQGQNHPPLPAAIVADLTARLASKDWTIGSNPVGLRSGLGAAVAHDYQSGATVTIEGWQIARTQAELCALAYFATTGML